MRNIKIKSITRKNFKKILQIMKINSCIGLSMEVV